MQRFLSVMLAAMLLLSLAACGKEKQQATENAETAAVTETIEKTDVPTDEETKGNHEVISLSFIKTFDQTPSLEEQSIYEKDGVTITAKSIKYDTVHGPQIILEVKNDTDNDLLIQNNHTTVNGFMMKPEIDLNVPKHKKLEAPMSLPYLDLAMADIHSLSDVGISLSILDSKTFSVLDTTETVKLDLLNTSDSQTPFNEEGQLAFDSKGVKVILQGVKKDTLFDSRRVLMVYLKNDTDRTICVKNNQLKVNGYDITTTMSTVILPHTKAVDKIELFDQDLDEYGITTIDAVNVAFEVNDYEDWKPIVISGTISVELPTEIISEEEENASEPTE